MRQRIVTLTNAQIKALPTTGVELIPVPGDNRVLIPTYALGRIITGSSGAYTLDPFASLSLLWLGGAYASTPTQIGSLFGTNDLDRIIKFFFPETFVPDSGNFQGYPNAGGHELSQVENKSIIIKDDWMGVADYTGGHVNNSLRVSIGYVIYNVTSGRII